MKSRVEAASATTMTRPSDDESIRLEQRAIQRLRENKFRVTMSRVQVIRVLAESRVPLTAYRIQEAVVERGGRIDVVSVYRILSTLTQIGLAYHVGIVGGYIACRMDREHEDQVHLVCESCGRIEELALSEPTRLALEAQLGERRAHAKAMTIEVLGLCSACPRPAP